MSSLPSKRGRGGRLIGLFVFLVSLYMIVYSARIESGDTRLFFDATSSLVDHGDLLIDLSASIRPPNDSHFDATNPIPLANVDLEPMQIIAAAPLYALAKIVPGFGLVHTVWLFNALVVALTACVLYLYALTLGYGERTAVTGALLFGVGTVLFPYTRTLFREPLAGFFLLVSAWSLEKMRRTGYRSALWGITAGASILAMFLTKASTLLALPALFIFALPPMRSINRRYWIALGIGIIAVFVVFILLNLIPIAGNRFDILARLNAERRGVYVSSALGAYLLSPGGSFWGTSPVLLLCVPGFALLIQKREWRYPIALIGLALAFAFGYAFTSNVNWFGGLSFPPRFLVPIIPLWVIGILPALEKIQSRRITPYHAAAVLLIGYSVWVQLSGVTLELTTYPANLPPEANGLIEWSGGLYDPRYFRWVVVPSLWRTMSLDFAWVRLNLPVWGIAFGILAVVSGMIVMRRSVSRRVGLALAGVLLISLVIGLQLLYRSDWRYGAQDRVAFRGMETVVELTHAGDVLLLSNPRYEDFFQNYGKWWDDARLITLPLQPGERPSPEQPAPVTSDNPSLLLNPYTIPLLHNLAATHDRMWLLVDSTPDLAWNVRPVERFMSAFYHPIQALQIGDFFRLVEYSTAPAPDPYGFLGANYPTDFVFGDSIQLLGVHVDVERTYQAGGALPLSLLWRTDSSLQTNYTIAVYLRDSSGAPVAQNDYPPAGGFAPTDTWIRGVPVWDNRAVRLPIDLPDGDYQVWVKVYDFAPDGGVRDLPVRGSRVLDNTIGVLPLMVRVANSN